MSECLSVGLFVYFVQPCGFRKALVEDRGGSRCCVQAVNRGNWREATQPTTRLKQGRRLPVSWPMNLQSLACFIICRVKMCDIMVEKRRVESSILFFLGVVNC